MNIISYFNKKCNLIETSTDACYMQLKLVDSLLHNQYGLFLLSITSLNNLFKLQKIKTVTNIKFCTNHNLILGILNLCSTKEQGYDPYTTQLLNSQYVNNLLTQ